MNVFFLSAILLSLASSVLEAAGDATPQWEPCGWGGGGFYWSAAFSSKQNGVIYLGGDVGGIYKSEDNGRSWRMINNGIAGYGIFSIAVDPKASQNVYAATDGGLCKSIDAGEHWTLLPQAKEDHLKGLKGKSIRCIAVDPNDSNIVYMGAPTGKVYKSMDGGQKWDIAYEKKDPAEDPNALHVQFGKVNGDFFGGYWLPLEAKPANCVGFGFTFKGDGSTPQRALLTLKTSSGATYWSKNLSSIFQNTGTQDVSLDSSDFTLAPDYLKAHPDAAKTLAVIDWSTVNRLDFSCDGPLPTASSTGQFSKFFFLSKANTTSDPVKVTAKDFTADKSVRSYGNIRFGTSNSSTVFTVAVAPSDSSLVAAATSNSGLVLSQDAGQTWTELPTPKKATTVAFDPANPSIIYGGFGTDGIWKSTDKGKTWTHLTSGGSITEIAVNPANSLDVYGIGSSNWSGEFLQSHDAGQTWSSCSPSMGIDLKSDPTLPGAGYKNTTGPLSTPTNLAINPMNPQELYISANWRSSLSEDGGKTWTERDQGADISCISDIRFSGNRVYTCAMDEGTFVRDSSDNTWKQLWPLEFNDSLSGHNWRLAVNNINGKDRIIGTVSPWDSNITDRVVVADDNGSTFHVVTTGLPDYVIRPNTMWGQGHPRALAVDPKNPNNVYLGIDGDPEPGKSGGGVFKSVDGGNTWAQLPQQPGSRRMFYGLVVDPTDSNRLYWGCCSTGGGLYRSDDAGGSWKNVFSREQWIFNVQVAVDGTIYCPGNNLWSSSDHGATWKQLTHFTDQGQMIGIETDPRDPKTVWISNSKAVYKTTDAGATWQNISGNLPYVAPMVLRFNPATNELWGGGVGLFKLNQ